MQKTIRLSTLLFFLTTQIWANQILLEFKTACVIPTKSLVRHIYGKALPEFGPEVTFQLNSCDNWYGFASIDFIRKNGHSIGLCDRTQLRMSLFAFGVKYFVPFCYGNFYIGAGMQPIHVKTENCSQFVTQKTAQWGPGAVIKIGSYFTLPHNLFINLFADYSIARLRCSRKSSCTVPLRVNLDGALFGVGFGYCFE